MPRNTDIKKVLLIGSGPIMIGQAAEFDFSGSQACRSLREEGVSVVLINSNPATIMTDPEMADVVYIEPIHPLIVERIIEKERPDGVIAGLGGQTGLNIVSELAGMGVLEKYNVKLYGTPLQAIQDTEDRDLFKQAMQRIGEPVPRSKAVSTMYLFNWDEIPGNDNGKLIEFLKQKFGIDWVKTEEIKKIDNGNIINIYTEINHLSLNLNKEKTEVIFEIDDVRIDKFIAKMEKGKPNIYNNIEEAMEKAVELIDELNLPLVIRPAYTLGGAGGGIARTKEEFISITELGLKRSRINQVLIEEGILGWKEFEYEVMRDANDTCIVICNMENIDPMGIHTGESIVVTPSQTLSDRDHQMLRSASINIIKSLGIEGGCNIQFAVKDGEYRIVEVNPRVSRSSALASKATGYPIARVTAKIAIGMTLDEIQNDVTKKTPASFEPTVDYTVVKIPRWPFDKFVTADKTLTTAMKSTGEVMAIGRTIEEAMKKAIRSLDVDMYFGFREWDREEVIDLLKTPTHERLFGIYHCLRTGFSIDEISGLTSIDPFFLEKIHNIIRMEDTLRLGLTRETVRSAKRMGFTDEEIGKLTGRTREDINDMRRQMGITTTYKMVDTCAAEFAAETPYYYSCYEEMCENEPTDRKKVLILGAGPIRIGQGIEFDYCTVHAVSALREEGIETHIINNNPETVSTDYDTSDKLFFEPLTLEDVMNVIERERPWGVMVQFGGQTSVNLALPLQRELQRRTDLDTVILGTTPEDMDIAEDRERFNKMLHGMGIPQPEAGYAITEAGAREVAAGIGYPVLVRPSYVLGGRAMEIVYDENDLNRYMNEAVRVSPEHPVLIDNFLEGAIEIDVDAICDGEDVLIGAIMEHIEEAGIHSGDSACVIPPQSLGLYVLDTVRDYVRRIALALGVKGILNIQMAYKDRVVYVLEANPRSSRTIPFVSKAVGLPLAKIAARAMIGITLKEQGYLQEPRPVHVSVKEVLLPFDKLPGADPILSPEMRSTGEVMGVDYSYGLAFFKAELAADNALPLEGKVFMSIRDQDKPALVQIARKIADAGLEIIATSGTVRYLAGKGFDVTEIKKVHDGSPNVIDLMRKEDVGLVINTPTSRMSYKDGRGIRRAAVDYAVPYITTIQAAMAAADAIEAMSRGEMTVKSIGEYHLEM